MIDAHCHVHEKPSALRAWLSSSVLPVLTGHSPSSNRKAYSTALDLGLPFVVGIAPQTAQRLQHPLQEVENLKPLLPTSSALGEIGLDNHWAKGEEERERQREAFTAQLRLARQLGKPVVIHSRKAIEEVVDLLNQHYAGKVLFHFFSENVKALEALKGSVEFTLSIVGLPSKERKRAISSTSLSQLVVETDGPYVVRSPEGLEEAVSYISRVKALPREEVAQAVERNAAAFYGIKALKPPSP